MFFKKILRRVRFFAGKYLALARPSLIQGLSYEKGCRIYENVRFRVTDGGVCHLGAGTVVERLGEITASGGEITIGGNSFIGQGTIIVSRSRISIGENCLIAENVTIRDQNHKFGVRELIHESGFDVKEIEIGDNVWIGAKVCILAGVIIGEGSVIGAGSVVTKTLPSRIVAVGNPARILRHI